MTELKEITTGKRIMEMIDEERLDNLRFLVVMMGNDVLSMMQYLNFKAKYIDIGMVKEWMDKQRKEDGNEYSI